MRVELQPARLVHTGPIASRMRDMDRKECEALGRTPKEALRRGLATSLSAYTAIGEGRPVSIIGVCAENMLEGKGVIWMLGTDDVYRSGKAMLKFGPPLLEMWLDRFKVLENIVSIDNAPAINMLQKMGFTIDITDVRTHGGMDFIPFWIKREVAQVAGVEPADLGFGGQVAPTRSPAQLSVQD